MSSSGCGTSLAKSTPATRSAPRWGIGSRRAALRQGEIAVGAARAGYAAIATRAGLTVLRLLASAGKQAARVARCTSEASHAARAGDSRRSTRKAGGSSRLGPRSGVVVADLGDARASEGWGWQVPLSQVPPGLAGLSRRVHKGNGMGGRCRDESVKPRMFSCGGMSGGTRWSGQCEHPA